MAAAVSIEVSTLWNYVLNRAWTWGDRDRSWWSLLSYHGVVAVGLVLQWSTIAVGTGALGFHYLWTAAAGIALGTAWNFLANHRVTFQAYTPERRRRHLRIASYVGAATLYLGVALLLTHDWDTFVFQRSVEEFAVEGRTPYETAANAPAYTFSDHGLPVQQLWYAYPPLPLLLMTAAYGPALGFGAVAPWVARLLVKAPFLLANLALAGTARHFVRTAPDAPPLAERRADRLERWVLFNPLLIAVAGIWGQFESLLVLLLLLSLVALRTGRHATAGIAWGVACLIKPFPILLGPLLLGYLVRRSGLPSAIRYFGAGAIAFGLVSLPFLVRQPNGYLQQVFLLHAERAPSGMGLVPFLYESARWVRTAYPGTVPGDGSLIELAGLLSLSLTAFAVLAVTFAFWARPATERNLVFGSGAVFIAAFLFSKTVHEQYFVLPLALLLVAAVYPRADPASADSERSGGVIAGTSFLLPAALMVSSIHFVMFIPDDVLAAALGAARPEVMAAVAGAFGVAVSELATTAALVAGCLLLPVFILAFRFVIPLVEDGIAAVLAAIVRLLRRVPYPRPSARIVVAALVILLLVPSIALGALAPRTEAAADDAGVVEGPVLLVKYRTDWFNPTHRPERAAGSWDDVAVTPEAGYYNPNAFKIQADLMELRDVGVSGILIPTHPDYEPVAGTLFGVAERLAIPHALEVDLTSLAGVDGRVPLTEQTARQAAELLDGPTLRYHDGSYHVRTGPDQGRLLVIRGVDLLSPVRGTGDDSARPPVDDAANGSATGMAAIVSTEGNDTARPADIMAAAYEHARTQWWRDVFSWVDNDTRLHVLADGPIDLGSELEQRVHVEVGTPTRLAPSPGAPAAYDAAWRTTIADGAALIVVPWNDFDQGLGIEPTEEHGAALLTRTAVWWAAYRGLGSAAPQPTVAFLADVTPA